MSRGKSGPRQPGGGRQQAGPRHKSRQARHQSFRHPEVRAQRADPRPAVAGAEQLQAAGKVRTVSVTADESGMRVDRFFEARFPGLSFSHIQRIIRKGEVRVNGRPLPGGRYAANPYRRGGFLVAKTAFSEALDRADNVVEIFA